MAEFDDINTLGVIHLDAPPVAQGFNDVSFTKVTVFSAVQFQRGNITASAIDDQVVINVNEDYEISAGVNVEMTTTEQLDMAFFINNVQVGTVVKVQGRGAGKPVYLSGNSFASLTAGNIVDIRARNGDAGTVNVTFQAANLAVRKV